MKIKSQILILIFGLQFLTTKAQADEQVNAEFDPTGKTYKALTGETCKSMTGGGCMLYIYRTLNFRKDSVMVSYQVKAYCSNKQLENGYEHMYDNLTCTFKWSMNKEVVDIKGFSDYGKLFIQNSKLISESKIEFNEEVN